MFDFWTRVDRRGEDECWLWTGALNFHGYGAVKVKGEQIGTHRYAFFLTHGFWPRVCRHTCGTRACCNPKHLRDGSHQDNAADRSADGSETGSRNGRAKLTEADIPVIRRLLADGVSKREIGRRYGVTDVAIGFVASGRNWRHVP